jgi:hypothetical protein
MGFQRIKQILDNGMSIWTAQNGMPDFSGHGPTFSWNSKAELLAAFGHGVQLIQPGVIGNGNGAQANLVVDLRTGVNKMPRMPKGGPFISDPEIQEIQDWIDAGCPD